VREIGHDCGDTGEQRHQSHFSSVTLASRLRGKRAVMYSCGMCEYSGTWACTIGLPAKSASPGVILMVVPGLMGICLLSPPLDGLGNSYGGIEFCKRLVQTFKWSIIDVLFQQHKKV